MQHFPRVTQFIYFTRRVLHNCCY